MSSAAPNCSPGDPLDSLDQVEMLVLAQDREGVLARQGANPSIVGRNRGTRFSKLDAQFSIPNCRLLNALEHLRDRNDFVKPALVPALVPGERNSEAIFAQNDDWDPSGTAAANVLVASGWPSAIAERAFVSRIKPTPLARFSRIRARSEHRFEPSPSAGAAAFRP